MFHNVDGFSNDEVRHILPTEEELRALPSPFYNCHICGLRVKTQSNLRAHQIKTHGLINDPKDFAFLMRKKTEIKDVFHCPVKTCKYASKSGKGFSKYWHIKQHYQMVHMNKEFQCQTCLQRFPTPSSHAYHHKTCGVQYKCPVCGRKYRAKKFLNQHARRKGHDIVSVLTPEKSAVECRRVPSSADNASTSPNHREVDPPAPSVATRFAILPVVILPVGGPGGRITASDIAGAISQLSRNFSVLPPTTGASSDILQNCDAIGYSSDQRSEGNVVRGAAYGPGSRDPPLLHPLSVAIPSQEGLVASFQQTSPEGSSFVPLIDVGTATKRLSSTITQTDVNLPHPTFALHHQIHPLQPGLSTVAVGPQETSTEDDFTVMYQHQQLTRDSCIGTSPSGSLMPMRTSNSPPNFLPHMSHSSTYMTPGHSIELQYPEMSSNSTMTTYHQKTASTATSILQPAVTQDCFVQQTGPLMSSQQQSFQMNLAHAPLQQQQQQQQQVYQMGGLSGDPACYRFLQHMDTMLATPSAELLYGGWRSNNPVSVCAKSVQMGPANSVAVETTFDLAEFDQTSSGNCCWPTTDSFSNMQTQTLCDSEFNQWLNSRQTQTCTNFNHQLTTNWHDTQTMSSDGVCVGVNTGLLTPETRSPYSQELSH